MINLILAMENAIPLAILFYNIILKSRPEVIQQYKRVEKQSKQLKKR